MFFFVVFSFPVFVSCFFFFVRSCFSLSFHCLFHLFVSVVFFSAFCFFTPIRVLFLFLLLFFPFFRSLVVSMYLGFLYVSIFFFVLLPNACFSCFFLPCFICICFSFFVFLFSLFPSWGAGLECKEIWLFPQLKNAACGRPLLKQKNEQPARLLAANNKKVNVDLHQKQKTVKTKLT